MFEEMGNLCFLLNMFEQCVRCVDKNEGIRIEAAKRRARIDIQPNVFKCS